MPYKKYRVLAIAEAANPEWVSVPLVGWSHVSALREQVQCHLVTQIRNAGAIRRAGLAESEFTAIDSEPIAKIAYKIGSMLRGGSNKGWTTITALSAMSYYYFEYLVWKQFGKAIRSGQFDIVHRITPLSPTIPSLIAKKCAKVGIPFVIGPLNGGVPWPKAFDSVRRKENEWLSYVRGAFKLLPGYQSTRKYSSAILIGSKFTWSQMPKRYRYKCFYIPENGIDSGRFNVRRIRCPKGPIRVVFLGRLVPYKGADMLIEAAAPLLRAGSLRLTIIGDGPQRVELQGIIKAHAISDAVEMTGWLGHQQIQSHLVKGDLFAFPSVREFGGGAVAEAMAIGLVPIVINYGGPAEIVTPETGYLVEMGDRDYIIRSFRKLFDKLVNDPAEIECKSQLSHQRIKNLFTWEAKAAQTSGIYEWLIARKHRNCQAGNENSN